MRSGTNALFRLPGSSTVARIGLTSDAVRSAEREIRVARWLALGGVRSVRLAGPTAQPIVVEGLPVTFWHWIAPDQVAADPSDLGRTLQDVHALDDRGIELDRFDPLAATQRYLEGTTFADSTAARYLRAQCASLREAYHDLTFALPTGPIHGDAHAGNLMRSENRVVLIDLETFATGPREWDLVPTAVQHERFGLGAAAYASFASAYAFDVRTWSGYPSLRRIREVAVTVWLGARAREAAAAAAEFNRRVASLRDDRATQRWHAY